jgi:flagellar basal body-associated protein FliL
MAEKAEKNAEQAEPQAAEAGKKKFSSVVVLAVVGFLSGGAGFATPYVALSLRSKDAQAGQAESREESNGSHGTSEAHGASKSHGSVALVPFGEVVANLNDGRMSRYLRLNMTLRVDAKQEAEVAKAVEEQKVLLKDWLLRYLSDQTMEDIRGAAGQNRLRREILEQFNTMLFPDGYDRLHDVLFEEFNTQ